MAMKRTLLNMVSVIHPKNVIVVADLTKQIVRLDTERVVCVSNLYKLKENPDILEYKYFVSINYTHVSL